MAAGTLEQGGEGVEERRREQNEIESSTVV